ncbi:uncharacterized protein LOC142776628 isoform X1 [Rhipicephalus microplus]|uniref:uncharacterized protein LOC142776628 isoform X1 n=1 Tax=Rhipicephalus microplus TaxID=6941 RepID=UPI003F6C8204
MPLDVKLSIDRHQQGHYFGNRRRVLQWLYNDLCSYRMYPGKLYEEAARALIAKFPNLEDSTGTGYAHLEFQLFTKVQLVDALEHSFAAAAAKIVDAARKKRHLDGFMKSLWTVPTMLSRPPKRMMSC